MNRFAFIAAVFCAGLAHAETNYFRQIEDLPIPAGLTETGEPFAFTEAQQSVIGVSARGVAEAEQVRTYYQTALPALGWALSVGSGGENETIYLRGREQLSLSFFQRGEELEVQVLLFSSAPPRD